MDYSTKTREELIAICKEKNIKGYSSKKKDDIVKLIMSYQSNETTTSVSEEKTQIITRQEVIQGDCLVVLPTIESESAQIIIADPPYNIGKDFGNDSDKQPMDEYLKWSEKWIKECLRILKPNGTMFIYGFS